MKKNLLFTRRCCNCEKEFIYCLKSGSDFRCYSCKKGQTLEEIEKEIKELSKEEYQSFMDDIKEYEENLKKASKKR